MIDIKPLSSRDEAMMEKLLSEPWDEEDWRELYVATETVLRRIAARHANRKIDSLSKEHQ